MTTPTGRATQVVRMDREQGVVTFERVFDATPEAVFRAFSSCEWVARWWGPTDWTLPVCEMDFRPGGRWRYGMRGPDGTESFGLAVYREIEPPSRLAYDDYFTDADGTVRPGAPTMAVVFQFHAVDGRTRVLSTTRLGRPSDLQVVIDMGMERGWMETWDRLEAELARGDRPGS